MSDSPRPRISPLATSLKGIAPEIYGNSYNDHSLEIYKLYLEMADRISERREKANSFFLTINAALVAVLAKNPFSANPQKVEAIEALTPIAACLLCYLWYRIIRSYRDLNSAKFRVVHEIERQLPLRPYDAEWESVGRGNDSNLYLPFTHIEILVPWLFMALHGILLLFVIF